MATILICDDDIAILDSIEIYLKAEGYNTVRATNGIEVLEAVKKNDFQCIVLDIMMPQMDGLTAIMHLRQKSNVPVILLSAKSEDTDKIAGLGFGADDYVTKPFNPLELIARVKSQVRRYTDFGAVAETKGTIRTGSLSIDTNAHTVTLDGENVKLTATEYKILEYLMINMGSILSADQIYEAVWNEPALTSEKTVTVHIRRIREKIEINPKEPKYLKVVWGIGYKIEKI